MDAPLKAGNWGLISASPIPWSDQNATPREMTRADMDEVTAQFVSATQMADRAGFDMIELHAAHGYLISSFISPKSNIRSDEYGGITGQPDALSVGGFCRDAKGLACGKAHVGANLGQ